ncbi:MAG TPA: hypothetical protein VNR70_12690 [Steroidobacteraceae bacterium]|nr:hypothetical protein [Steroidobacteraceae bacterium]
MEFQKIALAGVAALALIAGCHSGKTPQRTAQDVEAAQQEAQREVERARAEASKDLKSAAKVGSSPRGVAQAKAEGAYDIAMVKADGEHNVATEKCLTLQAPLQQACKDGADAEYETAKAAAKATRVARQP